MRTGDLVNGRYRLECAKGAGSGGIVWTAFDTRLRRTVALKRPHGVISAADREQFRREAEIAAQAHHPNLVAVYDAVDDWLVMEHLDSDSLDVVLADGPLPPERVARIGLQTAAALVAVHERGIVHRDVKPGNILVAADDLTKLTDFGISVWREVTGFDDAKVGGTPAYTAPEVAAGQPAGPESDVFSLGATLYEAVEGTPPFGRGEPAGVLTRAREGSIPPLHLAGPLAELVTEMLDRRPGRRPTADQVRRRLLAVAGDWAPPPAPAARSPFWRRRRVQVIGAGLAVALTAAAVAAARPDPAPRGLVGDEAKAEPCALVHPPDFAGFGPPELKPDFGNFNRCDVHIDVGRRKKLEVEIQLVKMAAQQRDADWSTISTAPFEVLALPRKPAECNRLVLIDATYGVRVTGRVADSPHDLCKVADVAVERVRKVLGDGPIPQRGKDFPPKSLARVNTCSLLRNDVLPGLTAGVDVFGGWSCKWYMASTDTQIHVRYDQHAARAKYDGVHRTVGGHEAYVEEKSGECLFRVPYQPSNQPDRALVDVLLVSVKNDGPMEPKCAMAEELTKIAADTVNRR